MQRRQFLNTTSKGLLALLPTPLLLQGCSSKITKTNKTNSQGQAFFQDNSTNEPITITVLDKQQKPIQNADVLFYDGNGFEAFITQKQNYLPSFKIFPHNSEHKITLLSKTLEGIIGDAKEIGTMLDQQNKRKLHYTQLLYNPGLMKAYGQFEDFIGNKKEVQYLETITLDERLEIENERDAILVFITNRVAAIAGISSDFAEKARNIIGIIEDKTIRALLKDIKRWDVYCIDSDVNIIQFMPTNFPTVSLNEPQITEDYIKLSWKTDDVLEYTRNYSLNFPDLTVKLGKTPNQDLESRLVISKDGKRIINETTNSPFTLQKPESGSYTWFVRVTDEIGNATESPRLSFTYTNIKDEKAIREIINEYFKVWNNVGDGNVTQQDIINFRNFYSTHTLESKLSKETFSDSYLSEMFKRRRRNIHHENYEIKRIQIEPTNSSIATEKAVATVNTEESFGYSYTEWKKNFILLKTDGSWVLDRITREE